jgi:hypothetical protein
MLPISEYWRAVARGIDAEETKARFFIHHNDGIGAAREAILRDWLVKHTPEPYRICTGFIYQLAREFWTSRQCDVLLYDPTVAQPDYAISGLAVVHRVAARLVIEVKTTLKEETFRQALDIHDSVGWLPVPTLCFAYDGVTFKTFLDYLATAIRTSVHGVPDCIAVHKRNYLFVRSGYLLAERTDIPKRRRPAKYQFAVDFGNEGIAAATFLNFYLSLLKKGRFSEDEVRTWLCALDLPEDAMVRISDDGEVEHGPAPPE